MHGHMGEILPSFDGIAQKQNTHGQGEGRDDFGMGEDTSVLFFAHARPTLAVLWIFPRTFQEDAIFAKYGDEGKMR
jgi:hypothetical protein